MKAEDIFNETMAMIDEMLDTGLLEEDAVANYRARAPHILTMLQNEIIGIENRYKGTDEQIEPISISDLEQPLQVDGVKAHTLLSNGLAAHLMLQEDTNLANFFQQRYEELKGLFIKPTPRDIESKVDIYHGLGY